VALRGPAVPVQPVQRERKTLTVNDAAKKLPRSPTEQTMQAKETEHQARDMLEFLCF